MHNALHWIKDESVGIFPKRFTIGWKALYHFNFRLYTKYYERDAKLRNMNK